MRYSAYQKHNITGTHTGRRTMRQIHLTLAYYYASCGLWLSAQRMIERANS